MEESFPASDPPSTDPHPCNRDAITPDTVEDDSRQGSVKDGTQA
jgi:hypothetical protein